MFMCRCFDDVTLYYLRRAASPCLLMFYVYLRYLPPCHVTVRFTPHALLYAAMQLYAAYCRCLRLRMPLRRQYMPRAAAAAIYARHGAFSLLSALRLLSAAYITLPLCRRCCHDCHTLCRYFFAATFSMAQRHYDFSFIDTMSFAAMR